MDLADAIIAKIEQPVDEFTQIRNKIINRKSLPSVEFTRLIKLLENNPILVVNGGEFTAGEIHLVEKAFKRAKIQNPDELIMHLTRDKTKKAPVLLHALLSKGCKITSDCLREYLSDMICKEMLLCHYKILLVVSRRYPGMMTPEIVEFCRKSSHPICKAICRK